MTHQEIWVVVTEHHNDNTEMSAFSTEELALRYYLTIVAEYEAKGFDFEKFDGVDILPAAKGGDVWVTVECLLLDEQRNQLE